MSKFSHLKKLDVAQATSWIDLPEIAPGARLQLRPAGESNSAYYNAMLRKSGRRTRQMVRTDTIDADMIAQNRRDDRELFPLHVIVGWENIVDSDDNPVSFSKEECRELLAALPDWIVDRIRNHAATPERFLEQDEDPVPDPRELAGNFGGGSVSS